MKHRFRRLFLIGIGLLMAGMLAYFVREYIRHYLLIPFEYFLWAIQIIIETLPQVVWWAIILIILFIASMRSIPLKILAAPKTHQLALYKLPGRIETWAIRIKKSSNSSTARWRLAHSMAGLAIEVISDREHLSPKQVRELLINGAPGVPPDIQAFIIAGLKPEPLRRFSRLAFFRRRQIIHPALDIDPQRIVEFLERGYPHHDSNTP